MRKKRSKTVLGNSAPTRKSRMASPSRRGFWTYKADDPPSLADAVSVGAVKATTTVAEWFSLSPGMRREIVRSKRKLI